MDILADAASTAHRRAVQVFPLGEGQNFSNAGRQAVAISPDGARMVYVANTRLYLRSMSELDARAIPGTEAPAGAFVTNPVFSPDGRRSCSGRAATRKRKGA